MQNIEFKSISQPKELWEIFLEETSGHVSAFEVLIADHEKIQSVEGSRALSHRLHRLKGSLGFIGFTTFSQKIKNCETLLIEKKSELLSSLTDILNELVELNSELANLIRK